MKSQQDALNVRRAVVLGAGVMGAQVATHLAAAGIRTHLLDLTSDQPVKDPKLAKVVGERIRSQRAIIALEQVKGLKPPALLTPRCLDLVVCGNFDDDMSVIADADWVFEAVIEKMDVKKSIHRRIASYIRPGVPISSNTSGLSLAEIVRELSPSYQAAFTGIHFFNPPRYMRLVELIPSETTDLELAGRLAAFVESTLGKGIVLARDTVNFIANRVGVMTIGSTLAHMEALGVNVETVDLLTGKLMGRPASATFRTMDVVGIDTFSLVAANVYDRAQADPFREYFKMPDWIHDLIAAGHSGQKSGDVGIFKKTKDAQGKTAILSYRPKTRSYEPPAPTPPPWLGEANAIHKLVDRLRFIMERQDSAALLVWKTLRDTMVYAALLVEEIAGGPVKPVDDAIRWGFNWEMGPFELWQALGFDSVRERMLKEGMKLPAWAQKPEVQFYQPAPGSDDYSYRGPQEQFDAARQKLVPVARPKHLHHLPKKAMPALPALVKGNRGASVVDIGDGAACLVFHTKMNALDDQIMEMAGAAVELVKKDFDGLVIANQGQAFSAGANLGLILDIVKKSNFAELETVLRRFQGTLLMLKYAPFPTVACPHGLTLGGGCEVSLHCSHRVVAAETYAGLVEVGVGLVPGAGGTKELALAAYQAVAGVDRADPMPFLARAFMLIGMGKVSGSGFEAVEMGLLPTASTTVCLSTDHQIARAKDVLQWLLKTGYRTPTPPSNVKVVGDPGIQAFRMMLYNMMEARQISEHDRLIGEKVATILCGGEVDGGTEVSEQAFLELERRMFIELCQEPKTVARIEGMLATGKPLRN